MKYTFEFSGDEIGAAVFNYLQTKNIFLPGGDYRIEATYKKGGATFQFISVDEEEILEDNE